MVNLRGVDLNLLTVFEAVYEERSQRRAAARLGMTQPAVSNALRRLRHRVGDPLVHGRAKGLMTTTKADDLYRAVHPALDAIRKELGARETFDPAVSQKTFVIAISFGGGALLGPRLFRRLRERAPRSHLALRTIDPPEEIPRLLRERQLDLAVHYARLDDPLLEQSLLMTYQAVVMARDGHPRIAGITSRERLLEEEFVAVHDHSYGLAENPDLRPIVEMLQDRVALEVPNTLLLPLMVSQTDLLAITYQQMTKLTAETHGVTFHDVPFAIPPAPTYLIWHPSRRNDPAHRWLREQCLTVAEELRSEEFVTPVS